jgi:hypothetical protein
MVLLSPPTNKRNKTKQTQSPPARPHATPTNGGQVLEFLAEPGASERLNRAEEDFNRTHPGTKAGTLARCVSRGGGWGGVGGPGMRGEGGKGGGACVCVCCVACSGRKGAARSGLQRDSPHASSSPLVFLGFNNAATCWGTGSPTPPPKHWDSFRRLSPSPPPPLPPRHLTRVSKTRECLPCVLSLQMCVFVEGGGWSGACCMPVGGFVECMHDPSVSHIPSPPSSSSSSSSSSL